jgi:hypothetical protein
VNRDDTGFLECLIGLAALFFGTIALAAGAPRILVLVPAFGITMLLLGALLLWGGRNPGVVMLG